MIKLCIEKPLAHEEEHIKAMENVSTSVAHREMLQAAFYTSKLWPDSMKELTVQIIDPSEARNFTVSGKSMAWETPQWTPLSTWLKDNKTIDPLEYSLNKSDIKGSIIRVIQERIQPLVPFNIRFVNQKGTVKVALAGKMGSWSLLGTDHLHTDPSEATLNYGWLDVATIIHEFCHVLGMIHEHQNPRGKTIQWDKQAVYTWARQTQGWDETTTYENIIKRYDINQINGSDYDSKSIMLYFFDASLTLNHEGTKQNPRLSNTDIEWIQKTYPGGKGGLPTGAVTGNYWNLRVYDVNYLLMIGAVLLILFLFYVYYKKSQPGPGFFSNLLNKIKSVFKKEPNLFKKEGGILNKINPFNKADNNTPFHFQFCHTK